MTNKEKEKKAISKRQNDGKPLSTNIAGLYLWNENKQSLTNIETRKANVKNIHSIRFATRSASNYMWINHTDYTVIRTEFMETESGINFSYNGEDYLIPNEKKYNQTNYYKSLIKLT